MNQIAALLPAANIIVDLDVATKAQFFAAIGDVFERSGGLPHAGVAASLAAREKLGSTGLGQGIAIPHGRIHGLREAVGAFARLRKRPSRHANLFVTRMQRLSSVRSCAARDRHRLAAGGSSPS